ncbi:hypothetical protein GOP47_0026397 [Adiantum capillus-veneris]|nr:hypothetical protein GOP47_0026397 [Adiantum capillus-veneris]
MSKRVRLFEIVGGLFISKECIRTKFDSMEGARLDYMPSNDVGMGSKSFQKILNKALNTNDTFEHVFYKPRSKAQPNAYNNVGYEDNGDNGDLLGRNICYSLSTPLAKYDKKSKAKIDVLEVEIQNDYPLELLEKQQPMKEEKFESINSMMMSHISFKLHLYAICK